MEPVTTADDAQTLDDPIRELEVLAAFQNSVAEGMAKVGESGSLVDDLLADRAADVSTGH